MPVLKPCHSGKTKILTFTLQVCNKTQHTMLAAEWRNSLVTGVWAELRAMPSCDCICFAISCPFSENVYLCRWHCKKGSVEPNSAEENSLRKSLRETLIDFINFPFEHHAAPTCTQFHTQLVRTGRSCDSVSPNRFDYRRRDEALRFNDCSSTFPSQVLV